MHNKSLFIVIISTLLLINAEQCVVAKESGPFVTYSHETFIQKESEETGLFIDGEEWYSLINLKGFKDIDMKFVSPYQFLYQENNKGIRLSAFAEKIRGVKDVQSCLNHYVPGTYQQMLGNKKVGVMESDIMTSIHYYPYYKGYCFDFHFSIAKQEAKNEVGKIIDSIKFVDGSFSNVFIKKFIYYRDRRIQLSIPDSYNISYESGNRGSLPSIVMRPQSGNSFKIYVTIITGKGGSVISKETIRRNTQLQMADIAKDAVSKPKLLEITKGGTIIYYYVVEDKNYKLSNKEDYPFLCQGYAAVDGSALYFTILYREVGKEILKEVLDIIANARILNL